MRRKFTRRLLPVLLVLAMVLSLLPGTAPAAQAAAKATVGIISATVRIDYDQTLEELQSRKVQAELLRGTASLGVIDLTAQGHQDLSNGYVAQVYMDGHAGNDQPGALNFIVENLPVGDYTLRFTGRGYATYEETLTMRDYSRHLTVATGNATFTLGDVNGDNKVDDKDLELLSAALGSQEEEDLYHYDLNGDDTIDIVDLSYVYRLMTATGGSVSEETAELEPGVDTSELEKQLEEEGVTITSGQLEDLFISNGETVTFEANEEGLVVLPIEMTQPTELEEIRILAPASGGPRAGTVDVEDEDGNEYHYRFVGVHQIVTQTLSAQEDEGDLNVISIDLGRRVPVKKVKITVTETDNGFVTVESIEFLKEMIPVDPDLATAQVKGLQVAPGNERVTLTWNSLPNISGYRVNWHPVSDPSKASEKHVNINRAEITGLDNLVEYSFVVTAVDGEWSGKPSDPVTATPQPARAPSAPDMVNVNPGDGNLGVSWKAAENATYYEVYYTDTANAPTSSYTQWGERLTSTRTTITGLTNGVTYYIYVVAGNDIGRSGPSRISSGTPVAVIYERPAGVPTQGVLDYNDFAQVKLAQPSNYNSSEYPNGFNPKFMADGNYATHWTAKNWSSNEHVVVTFKEPQDLRAAIWVPRLDGGYPNNLRAYSVLVWYEGEDLNALGHHVTAGTDTNSGSTAAPSVTAGWPSVRNNPSVTKFGVMPFDLQRNVIQISVAVEQRAYTIVSLSEIMFLKYDENYRLPEDIEDLFADNLRTKLASGVTQVRIDELRTRLNSDEQNYYVDINTLKDELNLAQELLTGQSGTSVFIDGIDSRSGGRDSSAYGQSGSDLQPLGAAAAANTEITVYAQGIPEGATVTVYATQYNAEASTWRASMGTLENGRNILNVPKIGSQNTQRGGSLYIAYSGVDAEKIQLHVRRGTPIPVLDLSDWNTMDSAARTKAANDYITALNAYLSKTSISNNSTDWRNVTEIATPSVLLSLPAKAVQSSLSSGGAGQLISSVEAWEELMEICRTVQGINGMMETRQNIRCMQMFAGAFMYAAGNHIGIGYGSCASMVNGAPIKNLASGATSNRLYGWGIAHEIGHNMDKLGKAEITNNIYSLAAQTYDGKQNTLPSRLENSGKYAAIFNKTAQGYPGASGDVFVQLGMYWQLHLAYDGGEKPLDFYTKFFTAWKAGTYFNGASSYDDRVALTASAVAGHDLTEFFTRWGMTLSEATKTKLETYEKETRAVWYLNDQSRRDRLNNVSAASGTVTAAAAKSESKDNEVVLTFSNDLSSGKIQGYEIRRNGKAIGFTTANTYTDTIGTGNNRTYKYTVVAYDTLGNKIGEAVTEEVRIAYDMTIGSDEYSIAKDGGTIKVTFPKATAVTGLKLPVGVDTTSLKITITEEEETFSAGNTPDKDRTDSVITYFQRPGADASQATQVWTYQAKTVTITGLPETLALDDIKLISYMGDDIAFLDGSTVGCMASEYRYGPDEEDVIPEGTLVVIGTYRGDPTYNTIRIVGDFSAPDMAQDDGGEAPSTEGVVRPLNGYALLFASESSDMTYTNISDGIFIFVPDVQAEEELTGNSCGVSGVLPSRIRAELWRTMEPDSTEGTRCTAQTLWINSPGGNELPKVELKGGDQ